MSNSNPSGPLYHSFDNLIIKDIVPDRKDGTITLRVNDTMATAVTTLGNGRILSAPLLNEHDECIGFVEMIDVMQFVVQVAPDILDMLPDTSVDVLKQTKIGDWIRLHAAQLRREPFMSVQANTTASHLLDIFSRGVRRVAVCDDEKKLITTCSQSDLVRYLHQLIVNNKFTNETCQTIVKQSLTELGFKSNSVTTIPRRINVLLALQTLLRHNTEALVVVNDSGDLFANFSSSDLRGLYQEHLPHFLHTVADFLKQHSPHSLNVKTAAPTQSLQELVDIFVTSKLHRLWIVDAHGKPVGVITLTDILRLVTMH